MNLVFGQALCILNSVTCSFRLLRRTRHCIDLVLLTVASPNSLYEEQEVQPTIRGMRDVSTGRDSSPWAKRKLKCRRRPRAERSARGVTKKKGFDRRPGGDEGWWRRPGRTESDMKGREVGGCNKTTALGKWAQHPGKLLSLIGLQHTCVSFCLVRPITDEICPVYIAATSSIYSSKDPIFIIAQLKFQNLFDDIAYRIIKRKDNKAKTKKQEKQNGSHRRGGKLKYLSVPGVHDCSGQLKDDRIALE